jgi:glutaminase
MSNEKGFVEIASVLVNPEIFTRPYSCDVEKYGCKSMCCYRSCIVPPHEAKKIEEHRDGILAYLSPENREAIQKNIGTDPTGMRFNSIVAVEWSQKLLQAHEINPLVNPGAITATSMLQGKNRAEIWKSLLAFYSDCAGRPLGINQEVFKSESDTNQRNQAIGYLMYAYEWIKSEPMRATDIYTEACSVSVNAKDLAVMAGTLANGGKNPVTGKPVIKPANVPGILAVMAIAGLYDDSGKWLYRTGLPGKSGVGGGIIAVSPGKFGIAVISPPLDDAGNSIRAQKAIADISNALGGNPYAPKAK